MKSASWRSSLLAAALGVALLGCSDGERKVAQIEYTPDMYRNPAVKAQEEDPLNPGRPGMRTPPVGTVPRGYTPYTITQATILESTKLVNPLPRTPEVLKAGQKYYNIHCAPCHGDKGNGYGLVAAKITQQVPSLYSDKMMAKDKKDAEWLADGRIFDVITRGQGNMPAYGPRIEPEKRWAIIHYIRALQVANRPGDADVAWAKPFEGALASKPEAPAEKK